MSGDVWTIIGVGVAILCIGGIVYRELRSDIRGGVARCRDRWGSPGVRVSLCVSLACLTGSQQKAGNRVRGLCLLPCRSVVRWAGLGRTNHL